ncbi:hypothetical protein AALA61_15050, partial [Oscillospiraceae bacterium 42-9]
MAKEITTQDEMEQVEALEKEAQEHPDASVFTRKLNKPFTYENTTVEALHFDFSSLSGEDTIAIEAELNRRMKNLVLPHLSWEFMTLMVVRACTDRGANGLRGQTEAWQKNAEAQAYQEACQNLMGEYSAVMVEAAENSLRLTEAEMALEAQQKRRGEILERQNQLVREAGGSAARLSTEYYDLDHELALLNEDIRKSEKTTAAYQEAVDKSSAAVEEAKAATEGYSQAMEKLMDDSSQAAHVLDAFAQAAGNRLRDELSQGVFDLMSAGALAAGTLGKATEDYYEVYSAAYDSISGQMGLFEAMKVEVETSVTGMIASLESQAAYMSSYSENLRAAANMNLAPELIAQLSDGSTESAAYLQEIVTNGQGKIDELNAAFTKVQEGKEAFAGTVRDLQVDVDQSMSETVQTVDQAVESMNLHEKAYASMQSTFQGLIDGANEMAGPLRAALGSAGMGILSAGSVGLSVSRGYATGTTDAEPGFAMVDENGPELVFFGGGEQVVNATETAAMQRQPALSAAPAGLSGGEPMVIQ